MRRLGLTLAALCALGGLAACLAGGRPKGGLAPLDGVSAAAVDAALRPRRLALLVGIEAFRDGRWPALRHAAADARDLGAALGAAELGGFDAVEVLAAEAGTPLAAIREALDRLAGANRSPDDTVLVYFSTHGTLARGPDGALARYLVTSDTDQAHVPGSALSVRELLAGFERLPSRRKVLVLASCHSGAGKSGLPQDVVVELQGLKSGFFVRPLEEISQASMVLSACAWGETAREDDGLGHDIYTAFLLEALREGDADGDGAVTASEAHARAMARTYYFSGGRQRPQAESSVLGADPIVLAGRRERPGQPVLFSFLPSLQGLRIEVDGRDKGELPARLVLEPGAHHVVLREPGAGAPVLEREVELALGDELKVEELLERARPRWLLAVRGGYQAFLDGATRASLVGDLGLADLSLSVLDWPVAPLEVRLDVGLGGARQRLVEAGAPLEQECLTWHYGLSALYRFELAPVELLLGPRFAGLHVKRRVSAPVALTQHAWNFAGGLVLAARVALGHGLGLELEARLHYFAMQAGEEVRHLGFVDLLAGLGWRF